MPTFIDIDRGSIEYRFVAGDPAMPTLVFLHEGLGSIELWRGLPDDVRSATGDRSVLVYSRHGYGRSAPAAVPRPAAYMHHEADVVLPAVLRELQVDRPVLIGHSDGASIALLFSGRGGAVTSLVCLAPHVFVEPESVAGIEAARELYETTDMNGRLARYHDDPDHTFRGWNDVWLSPEFRSWNIEDRLAAITAPVLVVQGTEDQYGTLAQVEAIERGVSGRVDRCLIEGAGHAPHLDAREAVVEAISQFVVA